ncbi:MAG: EamA family transporter [Clostridiales Family XIII bacterium]|jgi:undecaprenyl phosphate-alpha-L-ara4N flippase subunit ArnE|nr:EamA family transporter [Clostridiales Family XIII bacterium]
MNEKLSDLNKPDKTYKYSGIGVALMVVSSLCACIGQMFWKLSATGTLLELILGLFLYGVGAVVMLVAYKFGKLSVLQPIMSLNYVFAIVIGILVFSETMSALKVGGIAAVILGVILIGGENE